MSQAREHQRPADPGTLPLVGAWVRAGLPRHDVGLRSRIEYATGDELVVTAPVEAEGVPPLPVGAELTLSWTTDRGLHRLRVRLEQRLAHPPRWRVVAVSPVVCDQRRGSDRVPVMGTVGVRLSDVWWTASLVDVSEGGLRCLLPDDISVPEGSACEVSLDLVRPGLRLDGVVVRVREGVDAMWDLGLKLTETPPAVAGELGRFVRDVRRGR